jgi:hypothetical protein
MVNSVADIVETGMTAFEQDDDLDMLEKAFPANIKLLEALLADNPDHYKTLVILSRFYASYAFAFFEGKLEAAALNRSMPDFEKSGTKKQNFSHLRKTVNRYYSKGADYALRALETRHPGCRKQLQQVKTCDNCFNSLTVEDVPALFWYGFNLGAYVNQNVDSVKTLSKAHLVEKAMHRVIDLDSAYFHGSAHLALLIYYGARSPMLGGNLKLALSHYNQFKSSAGDGFLLADLFYARYFLYQKQERQKYQEVLTGIIKSSKADPSHRFFNKVATIRAQTYLYATDRLFAPN